jgi:hypothetical protein
LHFNSAFFKSVSIVNVSIRLSSSFLSENSAISTLGNNFFSFRSKTSCYLTATTGLSIPGFNGLGSVLTGSFASEGEEVIAQRGDGRVLGQETATQSYSDIYHADTFAEGTVGMSE